MFIGISYRSQLSYTTEKEKNIKEIYIELYIVLKI